MSARDGRKLLSGNTVCHMAAGILEWRRRFTNKAEPEVRRQIPTACAIDEHEVSIRFDNRLVNYAFGELDEVWLAYAVTIHKSQGSEFPTVVIPLATQHYVLLQRNLIYTGVTRGQFPLATPPTFKSPLREPCASAGARCERAEIPTDIYG